jgi:hypothetical protein
MLGQELLGHLGKGRCALVSGSLGGRIGTVRHPEPSVFLASARASSGVSVPTLPRVRRRVGAPRPLPARYFTTYDRAPVVWTRTPKPASEASHTKYSPSSALRLSTLRFVIWLDGTVRPKEPRNHRGTTGWGLRVISGNERKAEKLYGKPIFGVSEIVSNLKKLPTT